MSQNISSLSDVWTAFNTGMPVEVALEAYYKGKDSRYLEGDRKQCAQMVALLEEKNRPILVAAQRVRLGVIIAEQQKRGEVAS